MKYRTLVVAAALTLGISLVGCGSTASADPVAAVNVDAETKLAIHGYDPVSYHTDGKPMTGEAAFKHEWNGATWQFTSAAHRDLFAASPDKYAPQFGGYCAWAVSQDYTYDADPLVWKIVDSKLYFNYNAEVQQKWESDQAKLIVAAEKNWPKLAAPQNK